MYKVKKNSAAAASTSANVGYEVQLWQIADTLRGSIDAAEFKHVCRGLLFLKHISDAFEEKHAALLAIAQDLVKTVRANVTIDWTLRENVRAQLRVLVKRLVWRYGYGYPPDKKGKGLRRRYWSKRRCYPANG